MDWKNEVHSISQSPEAETLRGQKKRMTTETYYKHIDSPRGVKSRDFKAWTFYSNSSSGSLYMFTWGYTYHRPSNAIQLYQFQAFNLTNIDRW